MEQGKTSPIWRMLLYIEGWLYPRGASCLSCDAGLGEGDERLLCEHCAQELERLTARLEEIEPQLDPPAPGLCFVRAAYLYEGPAKRLIWRLKYESMRDAAALLAGEMAFLPAGEEELIVPVPTDAMRQKKRGYNQAALLAQHIADTLHMPMQEALRRTRPTHRQTGLTLAQRQQNLAGCMAASDVVNGKRILLVDDVYTSGSTAAEAARALHAAGAKSVGMFAAARAVMDDSDYTEPFPLTGFGRKKRKNPVK